MKILDSLQIAHKIERMAYQIAESNYDQKEIYFVGINKNGYNFAQMLKNKLGKIYDCNIVMARVELKPQNPVDQEITLDVDVEKLKGKAVILVDDVANTGRTMFYAMKVFMSVIPKKIETAVLVDRMHKSFPISINHVGLTFATTIQDNIDVDLNKKGEEAVYLR